MADFCADCSKQWFGGVDYGDLAGLVPAGQTILVLCEGCGEITVDHEGKKVGPDPPESDPSTFTDARP